MFTLAKERIDNGRNVRKMELFRKIMAIVMIVMLVSASAFTLVYFLINYVF